MNALMDNHSRVIYSTNERESIQNKHRKSLIVHQDVSEVNPWFKPLQSDESLLLL